MGWNGCALGIIPCVAWREPLLSWYYCLSAWFVWFCLARLWYDKDRKIMPKRPLRRGISAYEKAVGPSAPMAVPVRRWLWLGLGSSSKSPHFLRESPSCMHQNSDDQGLARMYVPARTSQSRCTNKFYMYEILQVIYTFSFFSLGVWSSTKCIFLLCDGFIIHQRGQCIRAWIYIMCP